MTLKHIAMKQILCLLITFTLITSCGITITNVMPMGDGVYTLSGTASSGAVHLPKVRKKVFNTANLYAQEKGKTLEVISINEVPDGLFYDPQVDLTFRLVDNSIEVSDPNKTNTKTTINLRDVRGKKTGEIVSKKKNTKKDDEKYKKLLKLGELKEKGLLTEEEFQKEKKKILNDE